MFSSLKVFFMFCLLLEFSNHFSYASYNSDFYYNDIDADTDSESSTDHLDNFEFKEKINLKINVINKKK